jgi:hypothetical protein
VLAATNASVRTSSQDVHHARIADRIAAHGEPLTRRGPLKRIPLSAIIESFLTSEGIGRVGHASENSLQIAHLRDSAEHHPATEGPR